MRPKTTGCSVEGCDGKHYGKGLCYKHYLRVRRHGSTGLESRVRPAEQRFWEKVQKTDGCWEWLAAKNRWGYGVFYGGERAEQAHRFAYRTLIGPIPEGLTIDHLCRNPGCVNPAHLEPVTQRENVLRGETRTAANAAKTHCPQGHPYDEENTYLAPSGSRICRACQREHQRQHYLRRKARLAEADDGE